MSTDVTDHSLKEARYNANRLSLRCLMGITPFLLMGCLGTGTEVLDEPIALQTSKALAIRSDENIEVILDWVIVRDGPGTWAANADWDEYLLRVRNISSQVVEVTNVTVVDMLGQRLEPSNQFSVLVATGRETTSRYENLDIDVSAGAGTSAMMTTGAVLTLTGAAAVAATTTVTGSLVGPMSVAGPSAAAVGVLIAGPLIAMEGVRRQRNEDEVSDEIRSRHARLPTLVAAGAERQLDLFFPFAPMPQAVEINYRNSTGVQTLSVDTQSALEGLHLVPEE